MSPYIFLLYYIYLGLANAQIVETKFLELAMSLLDFSPRIPLGTFSILLIIYALRVPIFMTSPLGVAVGLLSI